MEWRKYVRLSYAETREFSERRSWVGILLIAVMCIVAGYISLLAKGKLTACSPTYRTHFWKAQVENGKEGCEGATVSVGQLLYRNTFTYVVAQGLDQYRNETLSCAIAERGATINVLSFAAPQFLWAYKISCTRPPKCCPAEIEKTTSSQTSCFCDQTLQLHIQDIRNGSSVSSFDFTGTAIALTSNYSTNFSGTVGNISDTTCADGAPLTVFRFDNSTYSAFSSTKKCYGTDIIPDSATDLQKSTSMPAVVNNIRSSVDAAILADISSLLLTPSLSDVINYLCYTCSTTGDIGRLLVNFFVAVFAIGSMTYTLVLWVLKKTQSDPSPTDNSISDVQPIGSSVKHEDNIKISTRYQRGLA